MPDYRSTPQAARLLGMSPSRLAKAVWDGRVDPPQKSPSGNFLWTHADIERASWALCHKPLEDVKGQTNVTGSH